MKQVTRICRCCGDVETDQDGSAWSVHTREVWLCPDCWHWFDARLNRPRHDRHDEPGRAADVRPARLDVATAQGV
jgi:hypothetical protein